MKIAVAIISAGLFLSCQSEADVNPTINVPEERSASEWKDPAGGALWTVSAMQVDWDDASDACSGGYRLATIPELRLARTRGICVGREACGVVWSVEVSKKEALTFDMQAGATAVADKEDGKAQTICIGE